MATSGSEAYVLLPGPRSPPTECYFAPRGGEAGPPVPSQPMGWPAWFSALCGGQDKRWQCVKCACRPFVWTSLLESFNHFPATTNFQLIGFLFFMAPTCLVLALCFPGEFLSHNKAEAVCCAASAPGSLGLVLLIIQEGSIFQPLSTNIPLCMVHLLETLL